MFKWTVLKNLLERSQKGDFLIMATNLSSAKTAKNDEFYTQYHDIEKEINAYLEYDPNVFKDKTILLPCDDPEWSNFTKYFAQNFESFGLNKLISTSYAVESKKYKMGYQPTLFEIEAPQYDKKKTRIKGKIFILERDKKGKRKINFSNIKWEYLEGDGDFRSDEIIKLRDEADLIITNPPFSLFRVFLAWVVEAGKKFIVIGNKNSITYKEVFPLIKNNKIWVGTTSFNKDILFISPEKIDVSKKPSTATRTLNGIVYLRSPSVWFTNLDHGRRHQILPLMSTADNLKFSKHKEIKGRKKYIKYVNYDAIEVPYTDAIPSDYDGVIGVPVSFLDKYSPEQFEILGTSDNGLVDDNLKITDGLPKKFVNDYYKSGGTGAYNEGNPTAGYYDEKIAKMAYKRIFIRHKRKKK